MGKIIQNYELKEQLGEGVYAKVYKAIHLITKQQVAIKVVQAQKFKEIPKLQECTVNEINILSTLQACQYIVKYIDMLKTANNFYFVYEYCNGGTLDKLMQKEGPLGQRKSIVYFRQIVQAFKVLTKSNIMHRDIKPDNILMHNGMIKIADFGFCKPLQNANDLAQTMLGSPIYMAPQVLKGQIYTMKADIWSLGVVLFQMVYGKCPFQSKSIAKLIKMLEEEDVVIPETPKVSINLDRLLRRMLIKDYNNRIQWKEIFQYTFTENGEIYAPGMQQNGSSINQFGLRQSLRNQPFQSSNLQPQSMYGTTNNPTSFMVTDPKSSPMISPKVKSIDLMKSIDDDTSRNMLMKKKSPMKQFQNKIGDYSLNVSNGYGSNLGRDLNSSTSQNSNLQKNEQYAKTDRANRLQILLKNHAKLSIINQMILQVLRLQGQGQSKSIYIAYYLYKSIQKQSVNLYQSLKKETQTPNTQMSYDSSECFKEFKTSLQKEIDSIKTNLFFFRECIDEQNDFKVAELQLKRFQVMKSYLQSIKLSREEDLILILQILDYMEEALLIKKDAYEKLTKEHLQRQLKHKLSKYNLQKDIF